MSFPARWLSCTAVLLYVAAAPARADPSSQMPSVIEVPAQAQPSAHFSAEAATQAYLAQIPASATARSDAYFEGGYWLLLWDFLFGVAMAFLILSRGWSAKMRDLAERVTRFKPVHTFVYWTEYAALSTVLSFPLGVYEGYFREHQYGLATQTFGPWMGDQLKAFAVTVVFGGIITTLLFGIARRLPRTWWLWGSVASMAFMTLMVLIAPVYLMPLFNTFKRLEDPKVTQPILALGRANGIPVDDVFETDASKQSTRMSANVSGLGATLRVTLNDNLLKRGSPEEIQAVMGHEMGHYVLNHVYKFLVFLFMVVVGGFALLKAALEWSLARWGKRWQIRGIDDTAVMPLVFLLGTIFFFVLTPIMNTVTRAQEYEADMYGLNASRMPDGFAQAAIHLAEYRKMSPGPFEEWMFYDHPSGRNRIYAAMRWKAENLRLFAPAPAPSEPQKSALPAD